MQLRADLEDFNLIIIKVGSNVITDESSDLDHTKIEQLVHDIATLKKEGKQVVLISSGAISAGKKLLKDKSKQIEVLQAQSSVGQPILMNTYSKLFSISKHKCAQLLLTHDDFRNRQRFLNARNTIMTLLKNDFIPILNENDAVSFTEITVGDNDHLAAMTAQMLNADLLLLITSSNGLYTDSPEKKSAKRIPIVNYEDDLSSISTKTKTKTGRGGMGSKIKAVQKVTPLGIQGIIAPKDNDSPVITALTDSGTGTIFLSKKVIASERRKAWLISTQKHECAITVDEGAYKAIIQKKTSLLPKGILSVHGTFQRGDCIPILYQGKEFAFGLSEYSDLEVNKIKGKKSNEIEKALGRKFTDEVIHKDNLVLKES